MPKEIYSHCRGCVASCGLIFNVDNNQIVAHRANPQSLVSEGYKCIKGDLSVEFLRGAEARYCQSQKRNSAGELEPINSAALMDEVAEKIAATVARHGPRSVALFVGTAGYRKAFSVPMARQLMSAIGSPLIFSTMTIDQSAHWVVDGRMGVFATGRPFFADVDVLVLSGTNPVISHSSPYQATPLVNQTRKLRAFSARGGKLIVVDPRKTETARQAHLHLQPRPGTDAELFAGLTHLVLQQQAHNTAFCDRYITGLDRLRETVADFTPEWVAQRTGVTVAQLREAAEWIGRARKPALGFGTGTSMSPHANTAAHMIEALNAICGGYTRAGDRVHNPGIFARRPLVEQVLAPTRSWEAGPRLSSGHGTLYGEFPSSRLPQEILADSPDRIRLLLVLGANPMMAFGDPAHMQRALEALDCLVVIEPRATETTALADYIVAPPIQYEVADFNLTSSTINAEAAVVQYTDAVVVPPPGTLNEWEFFNGVANRLGHTLNLAAAGFGSQDAAVGMALTATTAWTTELLIDKTFAGAGLDLQTVRQHPHGMLVDYPAQIVRAPDHDDGARLDVCPQDVVAEMAAIYRAGTDSLHKYQLINRRIVELMNSEFRHSDHVYRRFNSGRLPVYMHPDDIAAEGFSAGDTLTIHGDHGAISACVKADLSLRRGVVAVPHCWGDNAPGEFGHRHTSWLVSMHPEHIQNIDAMPQQSALPVTLQKCPG